MRAVRLLHRPFVLSLLAVAACAQEQSAPAAGQLTDAKDKTPSDFARFVAVGDGGHFDTAVTTYRNDDGVTLRLFAAVHVADAAHYEELQRRFAQCGKLLYELVGPEDYRPKKGEERGSSLISMVQTGMKNGLELEFQLDGVDYTAPNFVHADMTPREFQESMAERGENLYLMLFQVGMQAQKAMLEKAEAAGDGGAPVETFDLVKAFQNGEGRHLLRLSLAQQLESLEAASAGEGTTLLEGRNEKCLEVLRRELRNGTKDLGIYYGAAHLTHMERRLVEDMGFHKVDHEWLVAWDCTKRPDPKVDREVWRQRRQAKKDLAAIARTIDTWGTAHDGEVPTMLQLITPVGGKDAAWSRGVQDPWGNNYEISGYYETPNYDVHSLGEDGIRDTGDDLHTASPRDLRRMLRSGLRPAFVPPDLRRARTDAAALRHAARSFLLVSHRCPTMAELLAPQPGGVVYLKEKVVDPWGRDYAIRPQGDDDVEVRSAGPDGEFDTADDVVAR